MKKAITVLEKEIQNLPDASRGRSRTWTALEDEMILKYCPTKGVPAVAAILNVPYETLRGHYKALKAAKK